MFRKNKSAGVSSELEDLRAYSDAISDVQAVIWFDLDGTIRQVNKNFCDAMGYSEAELIGKNHRIFVEKSQSGTEHYEKLWSDLRSGKALSNDFERIRADGSVIQLAAHYTPVRDSSGKVCKVVKLATDISGRRAAMAQLSDALTSLSRGDLTVRLPKSQDAEFSDTFRRFNNTVESLSKMIEGINGLALTVAKEAADITGNANDLASRGESQAATLEETAAALEELSSAVAGTAENARAATTAAQTASKNAQDGATVVTDAISAMQEIKDGSSEISKIIEVIDSISFQTNLLALNAGIEAARAGDAGRGFAVVASEIRALAQRTAEAAKDISDLIVNSNGNVSRGAQLVDQTGESLNRILEQITSVVGNIQDISNASSEQSDGIGSVTQATSQMDIATQQNAVLAENSAQSAAKLAESAAQLRDLAAEFQVSATPARSDSGFEDFRQSA